LIRGLIASLWILSMTLASVYVGTMMQGNGASPETAQSNQTSTPVRLKSMTVPVIAGGALQGYVLTQIAVSVKPDLLKNLPQPPELLLNDEVFKAVYSEEQIDFQHMQKQDLAGLSKKIRENINSRAGAPVADDVFIQELHYMSKKDASAEVQLSR
jgi:hypothetical protein